MVAVGDRTSSVVTMSCYDTSATCAVEHVSTLVSLYIGTILCAILISNISSIVLTMGTGQRMLQEKTKEVNDYMRSKRLPVELRERVRDFYNVRFSEGELFNENEILKEISPTLRQAIMRENSKSVSDDVAYNDLVS